MREDDKNKANKLLVDMKAILIELDELEINYKETKERKTKELNAALAQLAVFADTIATRAYVIRELYWNQNIPSNVLTKSFGLTLRKIRTIAGTMIYRFSCEAGCGDEVTKEFESKSQLQSFDPVTAVCDTCTKRIKQEKDEVDKQRSIKIKAQSKKRQEELNSMTWDEYVLTGEWELIRDVVLAYAGDRCSICNADDVTLNIFPHIGFSQGLNTHSNIHYVLCDSCIPRCEGLIDEDKGETIGIKTVYEIASRRRGHYFRY